ncbi:ATP-binding protein [Actinomadura fibrosa]|uniref:ATP-binding protein n=1 Tax=Actinomadura fibrosa TaxID=111802 RepID=A0ABW2Y1Z9_9ACTN|nr:tetratricopeptide repeat protein [Actinomadura fibrosa]
MPGFPSGVGFGGDAVLGDKITLIGGTAEDTVLGAPGPPRQLPRDIHDFSGRTQVMARLDALLREDERSPSPLVVAITGMPGVGKTALAVHWAHLIADRFADGQIFVDLRGYSEKAALPPREALGQVLRALNVPSGRIPVDEGELASLYRSRLAGKRVLIVLDDAAGSWQVHPLLPGGASCVVLITARDDLVGLVARDHVRTVPLDVMPTGEALDLVRTVAGRERTDAEPEAARELVQACARLPLALGLAAANLATSPQQSVSDAVEMLAGGDRLSHLAPADHLDSAVGAAFDWSYRGLAPDLAAAFRRLGLIEGPTFTPEAVGAMCAVPAGAAHRMLRRLEAANLVQATESRRYRLHELLREYAKGRAEAEDGGPERDAALRALAEGYAERAREAARSLDPYRRVIGPEPAGTPAETAPERRAADLEWFKAEYRNLVAVIAQTSRAGWDDLTLALADAVYGFFELRRYGHRNVAAQSLGLAAAERRGDVPAEILMRHHLAVAHRELGDLPAALREARAAQELSRRTGDRRGEADALVVIARIHLQRSEYWEALAVTRAALALRAETGDRHGEATTLDTMARGHQGLSDYGPAYERAAEALAIRREIGDVRGEAETLDGIARIYYGWGRAPQALEHAVRALRLRREIGDRHGEAETFSFISYLHVWLGRHRQATLYEVERALSLRRAMGDRLGEGHALVYLSVALRRLKRHDEAIRAGLEALDTLQALGDRQGEAEALNSLSRSLRRLRALDRARADAGRALELSRSIGDRFGVATSLNSLALVALSRGALREARDLATRSLRLRRRIGDRRGEANALDALCKVFHRMGMLDKARRTAFRACAIAAEIEDGHGRMVTLCALAGIAFDSGDHVGAAVYAREAVLLDRELGGRDHHKMRRLYGRMIAAHGDGRLLASLAEALQISFEPRRP